MNAKKMKSQKMLAMAVVAMFAICSLSVIVAAESDAEYNNGKTYYINARVGDAFDYKVTANLTGTTFSATPQTAIGLTWDGTDKLSATSFVKSTDPVSQVINAHWEANGLTQDATQTIQFTVNNRISLSDNDGAQTIGLLKTDSSASSSSPKQIHTVSITDSPSETSWGTPSYSANADTYFKATASGTALNFTRIASEVPVGTYTITTDASYNFTPNGKDIGGNAITDSKTYVLTIVVAEDVTLVAQKLYAIADKGTKNFDVEVKNAEGITTLTPSVTPADSYASVSTASPYSSITLSVDTNHTTFDEVTDNDKDYTITISATGTKTVEGVSNPFTTTSQTYTLKMYASLAFTSTPSFTQKSSTYASTENSMKVLLTNTIAGAKTITYNWGDGVVETKDVTGTGSTYYTADHTYARAGLHTITITASNDFGNKATYIMYNAGEEGSIPNESEETPDNGATNTEKPGFFDEHGYQFIIFAVITILALVAFFYFGIQNPIVIIIAVISAILAVCTFAYCDMSGFIEELKGLFNN